MKRTSYGWAVIDSDGEAYGPVWITEKEAERYKAGCTCSTVNWRIVDLFYETEGTDDIEHAETRGAA